MGVVVATPEGVKGRSVNKAELARLTGKPTKTVDDWIRRGLADAAAIERGGLAKQWKFDSALAIDWIITDRVRQLQPSEVAQEVLDLNAQRARESKERADKYALENAVMRRELIDVSEVIHHWGKMISAAKRQVRGIASRLKGSGIIPDMTAAQSAAVLELIDEALNELAGDGVPDSDGDALGEDFEDLGSAA